MEGIVPAELVRHPWKARARKVGQRLLASADRFQDAEAYRLSASLCFYALSSLFPLLLVAIASYEMVLGDSTELRRALIAQLDAAHSPTLRTLIEETLASAQGGETRSHWGIVVGLVGAAFGGSGIFLELDAALEKIFLVKPTKTSFWNGVRKLLVDRGSALLLVVGTSVMLLFGMVVLSAVDVVARHVPLPSSALPGLLTYGTTFFLTTVGVTLCYRFVPEPTVSWRSAFQGALVATIALSIVRWPLAFALTHLTSYAAYGVVGALLLLVTWFYIAGCILLFGAAFTAVRNEEHQGGEQLALDLQRP